jgi:hypothetical protein
VVVVEDGDDDDDNDGDVDNTEDVDDVDGGIILSAVAMLVEKKEDSDNFNL